MRTNFKSNELYVWNVGKSELGDWTTHELRHIESEGNRMATPQYNDQCIETRIVDTEKIERGPTADKIIFGLSRWPKHDHVYW